MADPGEAGGGGYGAEMNRAFFKRYEPRYEVEREWKYTKRVNERYEARYEVDEKWKHMKRVKAPRP